jgi:DNA-binding MarR family transcriptional regulator
MDTEPIAESGESQPYRCDRTRIEDNPGYLIRLVFNSLNRALDQEMAPLGLTATQWRPVAMVALGRADTAAELARLNEVDTGAMTRTLDRLEAKKLLRRQRSDQDRRVIKIELTEEGQAMVREIPANIARTINHYLRGFSEQEVHLLTHFLRRMLANGSAPLPPAKG